MTATPLRDRNETALATVFAALFGLSVTESKVLVHLAAHDCITKRALLAKLTQGDRFNTARVIIHTLRKKMRAHGVEIATLHARGYALDVNARTVLRNYLAEHDAGLIPTRKHQKPLVEQNESATRSRAPP